MNKLFFIFITFFFVTHLYSQIKVACIGNSITEGYGLKETEKYPHKLQIKLGNNYEVKNFGVSGRTLLKKGDRPYWKEQKYIDALNFNPDIVIIKLGTNDTKPQNWHFSSELFDNYMDLVKSFKKLPSTPKIYICYPIPAFNNKWGINDSLIVNGVIPSINKVLKKNNRTKLIDLYYPLLGKNEIVFDGIHPNSNGTSLITQIIYNALINPKK
ncbi:MAG: sialate O-acetylesterase [Marinilabiliaceae bacterium]|nr:sialate O-acetylesterase [Marinilabiliaceae bacterium]